MKHPYFEDLLAQQREAVSQVELGGVYEHFKKGTRFILDDVGIWRPTYETFVVISPEEVPELKIGRPFDVFMDILNLGGTTRNRYRITGKSTPSH